MSDFFANLLDTSSFPARWSCGQWTTGHGYLHILSDFAIWGAYTAIPCVLAYFVLKRRDVPFPRIFWLFCLFIYSCGTTHLLEALIFWWPAYRLLGVVKLITAVVSWVTVIALIRAMPTAMRFPQMGQVNAELERANEDLREFASIVGHDLRA
ncbi:MAG: hybrid sensor histidine kinase/response regulator, partial [Candidatus Hydrogenedentes bacterium]|nr:hybrid sensor histidine kinase/response regulator [Candidatus Hydrogenedentota bacterium]